MRYIIWTFSKFGLFVDYNYFFHSCFFKNSKAHIFLFQSATIYAENNNNCQFCHNHFTSNRLTVTPSLNKLLIIFKNLKFSFKLKTFDYVTLVPWLFT